ncbi:hypothetical protein vseg_021044 [Gypsophila vaccaria]
MFVNTIFRVYGFAHESRSVAHSRLILVLLLFCLTFFPSCHLVSSLPANAEIIVPKITRNNLKLLNPHIFTGCAIIGCAFHSRRRFHLCCGAFIDFGSLV